MIARRLAVIAAAAALLSSSSVLAADDVLTIGFTVSRTGKLNNDSTAQMRGFELWRDELNDKGGISVGGKQYKINFVSYDDESVNARVQQLYTRLINQDKAQFLFSPYSSGLVATAAIVSEQYGRIMTILLVEQNVRLALALSDYAYVIAEGRPFTEGQCAELAQKSEIRQAYLGL